MTTPQNVAGATKQAAGETASTAKDEAVQTAQTAKAAVTDVAGTAKEQVSHVADEALTQVRQLTDQARTQAGEQLSNATEKLTDTVRKLADELRQMSSNGDSSSPVTGLARQLADKGEQFADYLSHHGPGGLVEELRHYAGRKPGTFLLGAVAAGVATGRVVKGAKSAGDNPTGQQSYGGSPAYGSSLNPPIAYDDPYPVAPAPLSSGYDNEYTEASSTYGTTGASYGSGAPTYGSGESTYGTAPGSSFGTVPSTDPFEDDAPTTSYEQGRGF